MKKILITGSMGYIGSLLSGYLKNLGYQCVGYDIGFFEHSLLYPQDKIKTFRKDVRDICEEDLINVDVVVHLAGISNDPVSNLDPKSVYDPSRVYSFNLAQLCKKMGVRFIFASSCSVYGVGGRNSLDEDSGTNPQTFYSLNKLQVENDLAKISDQNFSPIALRFATVFGLSPRIRFDVVINMFIGMAISSRKIILNSDGKAWRPNLHILDACEAIRCAIDLKYEDKELLILNVGSDENNMQILEIAETIKDSMPKCQIKFLNQNPELDTDGLIKDRKINKGCDNRTYKVSFEKMKKVMPKMSIKWKVEDGIKNMIVRLNELSFDDKVFKNRCFYRLQHLEQLYSNNQITDDLRWKVN